jgi:hypothetical protein
MAVTVVVVVVVVVTIVTLAKVLIILDFPTIVVLARGAYKVCYCLGVINT